MGLLDSLGRSYDEQTVSIDDHADIEAGDHTEQDADDPDSDADQDGDGGPVSDADDPEPTPSDGDGAAPGDESTADAGGRRSGRLGAVVLVAIVGIVAVRLLRSRSAGDDDTAST